MTIPTPIRCSVVTLALLAACEAHRTTAPAAPLVRTHPQRGYVINLPLPGSQPAGVAISRSGLVYVAQRTGGGLAMFRLPDTTFLGTVPAGRYPGDVVFNAAGTTAYVSSLTDATVTAIDVASRSQTGAARVDADANRLAVSPDGSRLFVTSTRGMLDVVDTHTMTVVQRDTLAGSLNGIALDTIGHVLYVASTAGGIYRIDAGSGAIERAASDSGVPQDLTLSPDGTRLFVANESGWVLVLDPATLAPVQRFTVPAAFGVAISPDGAQLWVTEPQALRMEILDAATGTLWATRPSNAEPQRIAFDASGATAVVTNTFDLVQFME